MFHTFVNGRCTTCGEDLDWMLDRRPTWGDTTVHPDQGTFQFTFNLYEVS